jgi:hypothetical protein
MTHVVEEQLSLFGRQAQGEAWRGDAGQASLALELEQVVAFGLSVLQRIDRQRAHQRSTGEYDRQAEESIRMLYSRFADYAGKLVALARQFESNGIGVEGREQLEVALERARLAALPDESDPEDVQELEKAGPSAESLRRLAQSSTPPQSWFDQTDRPFGKGGK